MTVHSGCHSGPNNCPMSHAHHGHGHHFGSSFVPFVPIVSSSTRLASPLRSRLPSNSNPSDLSTISDSKMVRISNSVLAILNMITLLAGLAALGVGLFFTFGPRTTVSSCSSTIDRPLIYVGTALFVVSFMGLIGACCKSNFFMYLYLTFMFLLIVGLVVLAIFVFFVTNKSVGEAFSKTKATDFQGRFWNRVVGGKRWDGIQKCLSSSQVCKKLGTGDVGNSKLAKLYTNISPLKTACCQPPASCGFVARNATFWVISGTVKPTGGDCAAWSNQQDALCLNCEACKVGFTNEMKDKWKQITMVNLVAIVVCIFVYTFASCAKANNKRDSKYDSFSYGGHHYRP